MKEMRLGFSPQELDQITDIALAGAKDIKINPFCLKVKEALIEKPVASMLPTTSVMKSTIQQMQATQPDYSKFQVEQNEKKSEQRINALKNQLDESKKEAIVKDSQIKQW